MDDKADSHLPAVPAWQEYRLAMFGVMLSTAAAERDHRGADLSR